MGFKHVKQHKGLLVGTLSALILAALSYATQSPVKFVLGFLGIVGIMHYSKELREDFNVPLIFKRDGKNKWGGRSGGLTGGLAGAYGALNGFKLFEAGSLQLIKIVEFSLNLTLILIFLTLGTILVTGTILQDVKDGYVEVS